MEEQADKQKMSQEEYTNKLINDVDKAMLITVKDGDVLIHPVKNIKHRWEVKGILREVIDTYMESAFIFGINGIAKTILPIVKALKKKEGNIIVPE